MKKSIAIVALMGMLLTSCVKNESVDYNANPKLITFEVAKYLPATRADVVYPTHLAFGAYAYEMDNTTPGVHSTLMDNEKVYYHSGTHPYWAPERLYYWKENWHIDFICYSPYNEDATNPAVPKISNDDVQQTLTYDNFSLSDDNQVDIMYSDKAMQQTSNTANYGFTGVPTLFHHALAKLHIKVYVNKLDNKTTSPTAVTEWETIVNSISINNIYNQGSLILKTTNNHDSGATTVQWSNTITTHQYNTWMPKVASTIDKKWEIQQKLTTEARTYGAGSTTLAADYFVLPQVLATDLQSITINYTINTTNPTGNVDTYTHEVTKYLKDYPSVQAWEMGKNVIYSIEIDPEGDIINFAPAVVDWEDVSGVVSI